MTSITLEREVKEEHEALKPDSLTWSEYLHIVAQSIDPEKFEDLVEAFYEEECEKAVERVKQRYNKARSDPDRLLDAEEARERIVDKE